MKEQISKIKEAAILKIAEAKDLQILNEVRVEFLGKKGELTLVLRNMGALTLEERPIIGSLVNEVRDEVESKIAEKEKLLKKEILKEKLEKEKIDVTVPSKNRKIGGIHPITGVIDNIKEIFLGLRL